MHPLSEKRCIIDPYRGSSYLIISSLVNAHSCPKRNCKRTEESPARISRKPRMRRKSALRLGGIPDETMRRIRAELTQLCGEPKWEDEQIAVFDLQLPSPAVAR